MVVCRVDLKLELQTQSVTKFEHLLYRDDEMKGINDARKRFVCVCDGDAHVAGAVSKRTYCRRLSMSTVQTLRNRRCKYVREEK